jgi:hypothetical protein
MSHSPGSGMLEVDWGGSVVTDSGQCEFVNWITAVLFSSSLTCSKSRRYAVLCSSLYKTLPESFFLDFRVVQHWKSHQRHWRPILAATNVEIQFWIPCQILCAYYFRTVTNLLLSMVAFRNIVKSDEKFPHFKRQ